MITTTPSTQYNKHKELDYVDQDIPLILSDKIFDTEEEYEDAMKITNHDISIDEIGIKAGSMPSSFYEF